MRLNRNTVLILLVSVIVIVVTSLFLNNPISTPGNTTPTAEGFVGRVFPDLTLENVNGLRVRDEVAATETAYAQDAEGTWNIAFTTLATASLTTNLTQTTMDERVANIIAVEAPESFTTDDLVPFGLDAPAFTLTITTRDNQTFTLKIGQKNPAGNRYYALLGEDASKVYLLTGVGRIDPVTQLAATPPIVVPPTPTPVPVLNTQGPVFNTFDAASITRFEVRNTTNDEFIILAKDDAGNWRVEDGTNKTDRLLDANIVTTFLTAFGFTPAVDGIDGADLERLGLAEPAYTLVATTATNQTYSLKIGTEDATGTRYYALVDAYDTVAVIEKAGIDIVLTLISEPPYQPEATPEATAEVTSEATAEATAEGN
jgi:hypothetical protein